MKEETIRKKRKRLIFRTAMLAVMVGLVVFALVANGKDEQSVIAKGEKAPDFQLKKFGTDETVQLSDLRGKGVMVNFWATYCKPCKDEMPYMEELYPEYKEKGVEILAVNLDSTELVVENFVNEYNLTFPILQDKNGEVMDLYNIGPIPSTLFINPEGEIEEQVIGPLTLDKLEGHLQKIAPEE
ncbi:MULTISPECIES: thiol-disulfide oxidoreductase ResA [Halobacillus]|uniref:Thiol-disulfide oxidoreductase ResA n=2 Tax=Halobacillus TaxID=45667 RepID=A0A3D8VMS0_9BACI|nr:MULTISPECIES: thiol-disulfide oxidoreductase ResA [Halobacillus]RDY70138.1 thiol-disulfide oxidoreductase ResA [Halobacillus trueperi]REJ08968.1 thiol-disulfide oxidoreductase ResA [Halobacillus trueperi]SDP45271.1 Peroxiredoxin [Halobacillus aidingensis]